MSVLVWRRWAVRGAVSVLAAVVGSWAWASDVGAPVATAPCVLVSGGLGDDGPQQAPASPEALAARVWYDLDLQVTEQLQQAMAGQGYRVQPYVAPFGATAVQRQAIFQQWRTSGCDWLVQVAHTVGEAQGQAYFGYDFTVAALRGPGRLVESLHNQRPRFVRDRDNLLNFRARDVIDPLLAAIESNGWLAPTRTAPR